MRSFARYGIGLLLSLFLCTNAGCGRDSAGRIAARILADHRERSKAKPLSVSQVILLRLSSTSGNGTGKGEIAWQGGEYRETRTSAGVTTVRGIQGGKAYYTDEDGVTRVVSDPALRELETRAYFWRRAYLFQDRARARLGLGPADSESVSVTLRPLAGNLLTLFFSRRDSRLLSARSPRFRLDFEAPTRFQDRSDAARPFTGEIVWTGLPVGNLEDAATGGGRARLSPAPAEVPVEMAARGFVLPAEISGVPARLRLDASVEGPVRVTTTLAARLPLSFRKDVLGRDVAGGATLRIGSLRYPAVHVERVSDSAEQEVDAAAGGVLFRETVVELDPDAARARFHDPAKWVAPEGYMRVVVDDDENRPVAILRRKGSELRVLCGSAAEGAALRLSAASAERLGISERETTIEGLRWGLLTLPPLALRIEPGAFSPDWGDDGRMDPKLLERFHSFLDMPHRWIYLKAR
jgi:hypothetical protein